MHIPDLIYALHQMRDVVISMWESSPTMIVAIICALTGATYFVFKK